jgi:hypothetical protein
METVRQYIEDYPYLTMSILLLLLLVLLFKTFKNGIKGITTEEVSKEVIIEVAPETIKTVYSKQFKDDAKNWWSSLTTDAKIKYMRDCGYNGIIRDLRITQIYDIFSQVIIHQ